MSRLLAIPILLGVLVMAAVHFSGADKPIERADFSFVNRGDNKCLDPNGMAWMQDIRVAYALWEGLYALDPVTLKPIPGTADKIDVDAGQKVYTFHIREDARWSNGEPVTAADFVFEWRRMLQSPGEYSYLFHYIKGAKEYLDAFAAYRGGGKEGAAAPDFGSVGIKGDGKILTVTLENPTPIFPSLCAFPPFFPLNEKSLEKFRNVDAQTGVVSYDRAFTRPPNLVTNGPYRLDEWTFKQRLHMVASDYYWDRANVKSKTIDQIYAEDPLAAFRMYDRGEVDWLSEVDPDMAGGLRQQGGRKDLHIFPAFGTYFYSLNCNAKLPDGRVNPLADVRVRQALSMAVDREPIVRDVARMGQRIALTYIPRDVFAGYSSPAGLAYDPAAARKLLAEAGYPGGAGFPKLTILYNNESMHGEVAQMIRKQWANNLGIDMGTDGVEIKVFGQRLYTQQYEVARASWYGDYDDPSTFTDKYKSDSDGNDAKWKNAEYDDLCQRAEKEADAGKRLALLSQAENILLNEAPIIPLYQYVNVYMFRDNVTGIPLDPKAMVMFKSVKVEH